MTRGIGLLVLMLVTAPGLRASAAAPPPPNILFVLIDDMGYRDLGCFGGTRAKTPAIDRLASEGMRFERFYVASPICSPSRCAFLTGQYPGRWRITSFLASREEDKRRGLADWLDPNAPSVARMLAEAGYHTAHVGKWHLGGQRDVGDAPAITEYGFKTSLTNFEGLGERIIPEFEPVGGKPFKHGPSVMSAKLGSASGPIHVVPRHEVTARYVDRAIVEMTKAGAERVPFFINLWLDDVHSPVQPPANLRGDGTPVSRYLGVVSEMDRQLGRAFDFVRSDAALRGNTIILLASDNGPEPGLGSAGELRGAKGQLYEGGIRSPLIVWSPGIMPRNTVGSSNDVTVICGIDLCPSLLTLGRANVPAGVKFDGIAMSNVLLGRVRSIRQEPVMWVRPPDRPGPRGQWPDLAIREHDRKLLVKRDGSRPELFDLENDPNENTNIAASHPAVVKAMTERVIKWDRETNRAKETP
jgi:uncharacterized sulfatase